MSRYMDADAFLKSVKQKAYPQSGSVNESERKISLFGIMEILTAMPTADVVEVVRCKDCKHRYLDGDIWQCPFGLMGGKDFYCGYAERKINE